MAIALLQWFERGPARTLLLAAALTSAGCLGLIGDLGNAGDRGQGTPGATQTTGEDGDIKCDILGPVTAPPLKRMSRAQYVNVLSDVVAAWAPSLGPMVMAAPAVQRALEQLREDNRVTGAGSGHGGLRRLDQLVEQGHVDASLVIAQAIGTEITSSAAKLGTLLGGCAADADKGNDAACVNDFIARAGRVAHRRALDADDIAFYGAVYAAQGIDAAGIADVVTAMLSGPYFFYQVEHGADAIDGSKAFALDDQELANRLSMQFWNTIPDAALQALVDTKAISTNAGYAEALAHVMADPRTTGTYSEFFREFFSAEDLPEIDRFVGTPAFDALRGSYAPTTDTREHMIDEVTRLAAYYAAKPDGTFADLFTTKKSFATTADVASLYGTPVWDGSSEPPDMTEPQRVGILSHAAMVATGSPTTRPIIKGVYIRGALLCDELPPPPANAMQVANDVAATLPPLTSTRGRIEAMTSSPACAGCHKSTINPLGFITEGFDPLGRVRQMEMVFDVTGKSLGSVPVDTSAVPAIVPGDATVARSTADLAGLLLASKKPQACMATKYFRYSFAQLEDTTNDACLVSTLKGRLAKGTSLSRVMSDIALMPSFRQRVFD